MLTEKKTTIKVPDAYLPLLEDLRLLKSDENNPNKMTIKQKDQVWKSLQKYGWTYPIITNKDGIFADGEQRSEVCIAHGEFFAPVLRLPVSDVDRRILRQILNKLKGKHSKEIDGAEYLRIIEAGEKDCLKALIRISWREAPRGKHWSKMKPQISYQAAMSSSLNARMKQNRKASLTNSKLKATALGF